MQIKIKYFASLREKSNKLEETLDVSSANLADLYNKLSHEYKFPLNFEQVKYAVNSEYVSFDYQLKNGDTITFIPPVAGG